MTGTLKRERRAYANRAVTFALCLDDATPADVLATVPADADTVYMTGRPWDTERLRSFVAGPLPAGWTHGAPPAGGHYFALPHPVLRFVRPDGRTVELHRAAAWFGEGDYTPGEALAAWRSLSATLAGAFDEGKPLATPSTTGRYLILRSIQHGREWPVLSDQAQALLRATSGQGRIQVFDRRDALGSIESLTQYDARFAYAALCGSLPAGEPCPDTVDEYKPFAAGWYYVRARVPRDWDSRCICGRNGHAGIGLLPAEGKGAGAWQYPAGAGETFTAWADATEVHVALAHGWDIHVIERWLYPAPPYSPLVRRSGQVSKRGPLDAWADALRKARHGTSNPLVLAALRNVVLFGIGALHGTPHRVSHVVSRDDAVAGAIPAHATDVQPFGEGFVWTEQAPAAWAEMSHPEWTVSIWGRARSRLLTAPAPGGRHVGMLHVDASHVLGCFTDSIWLANIDPHPAWADDGKTGRYRKTWAARPSPAVPVPASERELRALKAAHS